MFDCWKHLLRQQDIAVILAVHLHPRVDKYLFSHTRLWHGNGHHNRQQTSGIDVSLLVIDWCINPIVLRLVWWFDGKHFSSLNHYEVKLYLWIIFNRVSILPHFEHLLWVCLTDTWTEWTYVKIKYCLTLLIHKTICCFLRNWSFFVFCDFPR